MNFNLINLNLNFILFLLCLLLIELRLVWRHEIKRLITLLQWMTVLYEDMMLEFLVWRTRRKLRAIGKEAWADSIRTSVDKDDWERKDG